MGFRAERFDGSNVLIRGYPMPPGWNMGAADLILPVPPDPKSTIHGIIIPADLSPLDGREFPARRIPDYYVAGRALLSFRLKPNLHNERYLQNHMGLVRMVLAFEKWRP